MSDAHANLHGFCYVACNYSILRSSVSFYLTRDSFMYLAPLIVRNTLVGFGPILVDGFAELGPRGNDVINHAHILLTGPSGRTGSVSCILHGFGISR